MGSPAERCKPLPGQVSSGVAIAYGSGLRGEDEPLLWEELAGMILPAVILPLGQKQATYRDLYSPLTLRNILPAIDAMKTHYHSIVAGNQPDDTAVPGICHAIADTLSDEQKVVITAHVAMSHLV